MAALAERIGARRIVTVEDRDRNRAAYEAAGYEAYLLSRPWNPGTPTSPTPAGSGACPTSPTSSPATDRHPRPVRGCRHVGGLEPEPPGAPRTVQRARRANSWGAATITWPRPRLTTPTATRSCKTRLTVGRVVPAIDANSCWVSGMTVPVPSVPVA